MWLVRIFFVPCCEDEHWFSGAYSGLFYLEAIAPPGRSISYFVLHWFSVCLSPMASSDGGPRLGSYCLRSGLLRSQNKCLWIRCGHSDHPSLTSPSACDIGYLQEQTRSAES